MGFEDQVPPVPSRQQEIQYIENMKQNFLAQPYHKQYMNEALRETKIEHSNLRNQLRSRFWFNFGLGSVIFGIVFVPISSPYPLDETSHVVLPGPRRSPLRLLVTYPSLHSYPRPKFKPWTQSSYNQNRNLKSLKLYVALVALCSTWYALHFTDYTPAQDEYFTKKAPKVYPF